MKKILSSLLMAVCVLTSAISFATPTFTITKRENCGSMNCIYGTVTFDSSYPTDGEAVSASTFALNSVDVLDVSGAGYVYQYVKSTGKVKVYQSGGFTPAGTIGAGTSHNHVFTGTSAGDLNLATPAWSGTGNTAAGQVITTTDNQTMTLNEAAGMWLIQATATTPPNLILSNTAVTGAPAVLTVQGVANTDAGAYKIVKNIVPVGTNAAEATHTHTFTGTAVSAAVLTEVPNTTNLSSVTATFFVHGK